jgi:predicted heme/steroid binding protein
MDDTQRAFTERELQAYDGEDGPMYVAFNGIVYDVSDCPRWRSGLHEGQHFPGLDLSAEMEGGPHGPEVFKRPCVRQVGNLTK